jgi:hypothetical protein
LGLGSGLGVGSGLGPGPGFRLGPASLWRRRGLADPRDATQDLGCHALPSAPVARARGRHPGQRSVDAGSVLAAADLFVNPLELGQVPVATGGEQANEGQRGGAELARREHQIVSQNSIRRGTL